MRAAGVLQLASLDAERHRCCSECHHAGSGATAFSSAMCYAINAADNASDPVYADGWQAGDNGGTGFTAWNFDTDTVFAVTPGTQAIDDGLQAGGANSSPRAST